MSNATEAKPRLTRGAWVDAGIALLVEGGVGAISIERLATRLGVTRGSFYHHFRDRDDFLQAMLDFWAQHWTYEIGDRLAPLALPPDTTLLALAKAVRSSGAADYDAPFRAWALHDPKARAVVEDVDKFRLRFIRSQFEALAFEGLDAENRARLWMHYESAAPAIFARLSDKQEERLLEERHRFLTTASVAN